jgi:nitrogen fixation NifU-like protein
MIKVEDNVIKDLRFNGEACAISTSATSIMIKALLNKTVDEAFQIISEYENMIDEKEYNPDVLGEAVVYDEIYKQPNRKKCALLPVRGIKKALEEL